MVLSPISASLSDLNLIVQLIFGSFVDFQFFIPPLRNFLLSNWFLISKQHPYSLSEEIEARNGYGNIDSATKHIYVTMASEGPWKRSWPLGTVAWTDVSIRPVTVKRPFLTRFISVRVTHFFAFRCGEMISSIYRFCKTFFLRFAFKRSFASKPPQMPAL